MSETERDELDTLIMHHPWLPDHDGLYTGLCPSCPGRMIRGGHNSPEHAAHIAEAVLAAGYRRPRTITTPEEANELPDRSAFLTPGGIIFQKWENYYGDGKHAWERELGQVVPAELLDEDGHFPATVLHEPEATL